jgi:Pterin 4 alpha carbinolamine dehydratase
MTQLKELVCIPCSGNLPPMSETEIIEFKPQIPDWKIVKENEEIRLQRVYFFSDFKSALAFNQCVGEEAEIMGHHRNLRETPSSASARGGIGAAIERFDAATISKLFWYNDCGR